MNKQELIRKITEKKEFSQLPEKDVEMAFAQFDKDRYLDEEKIKLTRDLLRKVFSAFTSTKILAHKNFCSTKSKTTPSRRSRGKDFVGQRILKIKEKGSEWILRKHLSTRERLPYYGELYERILKGMAKKVSVIDLGAGINGFSYGYFESLGYDVNYIGVEAIGQFVDLMNYYFKNTKNFSKKNFGATKSKVMPSHDVSKQDFVGKKISGRAIHLSLFELEKIKRIMGKTKKPRVVFLFKAIDSLEMLERDYSKQLLLEITPLADRVVVSFATRSMIKRERFRVKRIWIVTFIKDNFKIIDDFESGGERYVVFSK